MAASYSGLSVVVPTRGRPQSVQRVIESLVSAAAHLPTGAEAEILVVDDSLPQDAQYIQWTADKEGVRYLRGPRRVGAKRNLGVLESKHPLVLFIDSDCIATPTLLRDHLDAHNANRDRLDLGAIAGPTVVKGVNDSAPWRTVQHSVVANAPWNWPLAYEWLWWAATSNLSVRKQAFLAIGGFDEHTYTVVGGEDVDLGVRLDSAGYRTLGLRSAVVIHATDGITRLRQFHRKLFLYGRACVYNCVRQPEHAHWAANPVTLALAFCTAAAVMPQHRRELLAASAVGTAAWFAADTLRTARRSSSSWSAAAAATSVDWSYHAGITREALRRGRLKLALKRFNYFQAHRFASAAATASAAPGSGEDRL